MMFRLILVLAVVVLSGGEQSDASSVIIATVTADNHYGLYHGRADGSELTFVGRNEKGYEGDPGPYNWIIPETWTISPVVGHHLYVVAWDDGGHQMWEGDFVLPNGTTLHSNATDWEATFVDGNNPGEYGDVPSLATLQADIAAASWGAPGVSESPPYGIWDGYGSTGLVGDYVWYDSFDSGPTDSGYVIFRSITTIPEPSTIILLATAALGLLAYGWRRV